MGPLETTDSKELRLALLVAIVAEAVYLLTLAPTVTSEDSGELITAAYRLGIAHPPGFPLWCLLARGFCLLPFAEPAYSVNLMSSVFGAATAGLVFLVCRQLRFPVGPSIAGALCLAFSRRFWSQAVITEVYTLNTALLAATILLLLLWSRSARRKFLYLAAAAFGLGLTNHYVLMLVVAPALLLFVVLTDARAVRSVRIVSIALGIVCATLLLYAYLPLAAATNPPLNWGDPSNWERFVHHVTRGQYRSLELVESIPFSTKVQFGRHFLSLLWLQFTGIVLLPLGLLGLGVLRRTRHAALLLGGIVLLNTAVLIAVLHFTFEAENRSRVEEYYLPAYLCIAVLLAAGLTRIHEAMASTRGRKVVLAACVAAPLIPLATHWRANDMSEYYLAYDYSREILESLEPDAVYFPSGDYTAFPAIYLQACENLRPDLILAETTGGLSPRAREYFATLEPDRSTAPLDAAQAAMIRNGPRPVYTSSKSAILSRAEFRFDPWGLVYRVTDPGAPAVEDPPDRFAARPLRNLSRPTAIDDLGRSILSNYFLMHGESRILRGERESAAAMYREAAQYAAPSKEALNNIGSTCAERGLSELAAELFRDAAALYPHYRTARRNLARLLESQGRREEALAVYRALRALDSDNPGLERKIASLEDSSLPEDPRLAETLAALRHDANNPALYNNLGNLHAERGEVQNALDAYANATRVDPEYALVYKNLALLYRDRIGDAERAALYFERFRVLSGDGPPGND